MLTHVFCFERQDEKIRRVGRIVNSSLAFVYSVAKILFYKLIALNATHEATEDIVNEINWPHSMKT